MTLLADRAKIEGKIAVVVGGASGIGRDISLSLAQSGVDIAYCDINAEAVINTEASIKAMARRVLAERADATNSEQLAAFFETVNSTFDHIDILVNVVGGVLMQPFMDKTTESCQQDIHRNYGYVIESVRHAVPLLKQSGRGAVLSILPPLKHIAVPVVFPFMRARKPLRRIFLRPWPGN